MRVWSADGAAVATLKGHKKWITSLAWEPFHLCALAALLLFGRCRLLSYVSAGIRDVSASRRHRKTAMCASGTQPRADACLCWQVILVPPFLHSRRPPCFAQSFVVYLFILCVGALGAVSCVKWGGDGLLYTASYDRTVKVWDSSGKLVRSLEGHGHRINHLALSTDYTRVRGRSITRATDTQISMLVRPTRWKDDVLLNSVRNACNVVFVTLFVGVCSTRESRSAVSHSARQR